MTLIYSANQLPTTNAQVWYNLMTLLESAGWTKAAAGDGISAYSASDGTAVTSSSSGANGFDNANAWVFIKMPGSNRGFVFQNISSTNVTIRYFGPSSLVTNSPDYQTPSVSTTPNAASQDVVSNTAFVGTLNRVHYWADNSSPYGFGVHGWSMTGTPTFHFMLDGMQSNTYHPLNQDPYVILQLSNTYNPNFWFGVWGGASLNSAANSLIKCWTRYNMTSGAFNDSRVCVVPPSSSSVDYFASMQSAGNFVSVNQSTSVYDGKDEEIPIQYMVIGGSQTNPNFGAGNILMWYNNVYQGVSTYLKNYMQYRSGTPYLNTLSVNSTRDRVVIGHVTLPNDGSIPLVP